MLSQSKKRACSLGGDGNRPFTLPFLLLSWVILFCPKQWWSCLLCKKG